MTETTLTPQEESEAAKMLADLHKRGYINVEQHGDLKPGTRIRHRGHRYPEAYRDGTGVVVAITEKPGSSWSLSWDAADIEMIVAWDRPPVSDSRLSTVAQYHVEAVAR
jgi:hypothetical protein